MVLGSKGNWWLNHPSEKYAQVKLGHLLRDRGENKESLKPPPSKVFFTSFTATYLTCKTVIIPGNKQGLDFFSLFQTLVVSLSSLPESWEKFNSSQQLNIDLQQLPFLT